jgi:hypothetical protein
MVHVEPPFNLLAGMVTVRVHLDAVPETNAPLLVAPNSHKRGRIPAAKIPEVVRQCRIITCLAAAGDIWLYATPNSSRVGCGRRAAHRRVLQIDYAVGELPGGLEWLSV